MENASSADFCPSRRGIRRQPNARNTTAIVVSGRPTGTKSNRLNAGCPSSWRTLEISRLGEVPMRVMVPPTSEPNASGIR